MMRTHYRKIVAALALAACSASASAVGLGFLADTPMAYLNKNDKPVFVKAVADVLNDKKDGETVQWSNEGLRNSVRIAAEITASDTQKSDAQVCRKVQVALAATGTWWLLPAGIVFGYACAWIGHFRFEHNKPATWVKPWWSFMGDWRMFWMKISGREEEAVALGRGLPDIVEMVRAAR